MRGARPVRSLDRLRFGVAPLRRHQSPAGASAPPTSGYTSLTFPARGPIPRSAGRGAFARRKSRFVIRRQTPPSRARGCEPSKARFHTWAVANARPAASETRHLFGTRGAVPSASSRPKHRCRRVERRISAICGAFDSGTPPATVVSARRRIRRASWTTVACVSAHKFVAILGRTKGVGMFERFGYSRTGFLAKEPDHVVQPVVPGEGLQLGGFDARPYQGCR